MSKEYAAAIMAVDKSDIKEVVTEEVFENLDGTKFKSDVVNYELSDNALVRNCGKFYANKIRRANGDESLIKRYEAERDKRIRSILSRG